VKNRKTWLRNRICGRFAKIKIINKARKERKMREVAQGKTSELGWVAVSPRADLRNINS
jgi:hypothetical protein